MVRPVLLLACLVSGLLPAAALPPPTLPKQAQLRALCKATEFLLLSDNERAEAQSRRIIRVAGQQQYAGELARGYWLLGSALRSKSEFDSSLYYAQRALTLFAAQHDDAGRADVYSLMAQNYKRIGDMQRVPVLKRTALHWARLARTTAARGPHYAEQSRAYLVEGIIYRDLGRLDSAKICYLASMALEQQHPSEPSSLPVGYADYGQAIMDEGRDLRAAVGYFRRALPLYRQQNNRNGQEHAYRNLSWAYRQQQQPTQAVAAADSALALGRAIGDPHRLGNSLQAAYLAYRDAGQLHTALRLLEEEKKVEQAIASVDLTRAVATVAARYKAEQLQARIATLNQENTRRRQQLWALGAVLIGAGGLLTLTVWQYRLSRRAQVQLQANHRQITEQAGRLTTLMQELHHRVKNNLAIISGLLRLQANRLTEAGAVQAVRESQQRVEAMSLIHQRLYQTSEVTTVNMQHYVRDLATSLLTAYGHQPETFDLQVEVTQPLLPVDVAVPLGLLLNELLTNAFKHAYATVARPALRVYLGPDPQQPGPGLLLEVQDNGPGIAAGQCQSGAGSFGQRLITSLSEQLGGEMELRPGPGALFRLHLFPEALAGVP
ncbi:sensor histidine kinase [Hymenobacter aquaticus]|uniref:histidine kinase n=1 Tax=Hymenobacter aquaticus TaxID=1867101 RepID=A0A4Z0Q5Q5_9BACT|nr:sensor histidine kinase [Hymenobacter aquaticus]TGE24012.1 sensor histidine kinase [Hymenobacter aquaticus]